MISPIMLYSTDVSWKMQAIDLLSRNCIWAAVSYEWHKNVHVGSIKTKRGKLKNEVTPSPRPRQLE